MTYQLHETQTIIRIADNLLIPPDPANTDYQEFLAWQAEGNEPEPAPVPEPPPVLTTEQKLEAAGLTVAELKELFGLP
jgi:antitoxin component HigA of HigAB toxin-antitoxin module